MNKVLAFAALLICFATGALAQPSDDKLRNSCEGGAADTACILLFNGEISKGDALHIERAITASPHVVQMIAFASPGGDPFEALKIADVLNKYFVVLSATTCFQDGQCENLIGGAKSFSAGLCASACALLYLAVNDRGGTEVYLHRPTFSADYFRALPGQDAEAQYNAATTKLSDALKAHGVSESQIESIMSIPSATVIKLGKSYPVESPWLQEWLDAKCGNTIATLDTKDIVGSTFKNSGCRTDAIEKQQHLAQGK